MTVNELITVLQALPETAKNKELEFYLRKSNETSTSFLIFDSVDTEITYAETTYINLIKAP